MYSTVGKIASLGVPDAPADPNAVHWMVFSGTKAAQGSTPLVVLCTDGRGDRGDAQEMGQAWKRDMHVTYQIRAV
jgi:hypothetical protein